MTTNGRREGPLDERGQIPGQMSIDDVRPTDEGDAVKPTKPVRASDVKVTTEKSPEEIRRERIKEAVASRQAKRAGLKQAGADIPPSSGDLHGRLEYGLDKARERVGADKVKAAVRSKRK